MEQVSLVELFHRGGVIMWVLLGLSMLSVGVILERVIFFGRRRYRVGKSVEILKRDGQAQALKKKNQPLLTVGRGFLESMEEGEEHCENVTRREANRELNRHEHGLRLLALIGTISPLIGLLGTVWGMVKAFSEISKLGEKVTPADFADGIWTGLLTTVAGLLVAIPAVTASRLFEARVDQLAHDLDDLWSLLREWKFGGKQ